MVFADKYLNYRYKLGFRDGHEQGFQEGLEEVRRERAREEGRQEGIQLGKMQERARWEVYRRAVEEAHSLGIQPPKAPPDEEIWDEYVGKWYRWVRSSSS